MTERQLLEDKLDTIVSQIVRRRDHNCITCGRPMIYETSTSGHFMHRSNHCVRWSLVNVNGQCWPCNRDDDSERYEQAMIRRYGDELTQKIKVLARLPCHQSVADLREFYRELQEIKKQNNNG